MRFPEGRPGALSETRGRTYERAGLDLLCHRACI